MDLSYSTNLPHQAYTPQQLKEYESVAAKHCAVSMSALMTNAGAVVAHWLMRHYTKQHAVLVITGCGNNAGDGFVVAQQLREAGYDVDVWPLMSPSRLSGDAKSMYEAYKSSTGQCVHQPSLNRYGVIVDAVFGIGLDRPLEQELQAHFERLNETKATRIAIDVPSGVNALTGEVHAHAFAAHHTITFIGLKQGLLTGRAKEQCGMLWFAPLGIDQAFSHLCVPSAKRLMHEQMMQKRIYRAPSSHKGSAGHVLVVAGGLGMAGAARLCAEAALRCGAGLVSVATHPENVSAVLQGRYELMVHGIKDARELIPLLDKADVVAIGPGLGQCEWAKSLLQQVLSHSKNTPKVMDADALNLFAQHPVDIKNAVLTPHPKEAARLLQSTVANIEGNRFDAAKTLARKFHVTALLKGPGTLIAHDQGMYINSSGSEVLASAGMGDVLSGIIASLLAQGLNERDAACLGAYLHGFAAQQASAQGGKGLLASDLFPVLRSLVG
ncbi:NAD(P)H-hydrate dehydratase [Pseudoalteromonas pernae]|uniref:NAD(P)H-hydrate dehydratase n=1 Tax=Pseudoalteromonas pernae TaxID=3118054 RepID=UPI003242D065